MRTYSYEVNTKFNELYHLEDLVEANKRIAYVLSQLNKDVEDLKKQQLNLHNRYQEVLQLEYVYRVHLYKGTDSRTGRVLYEVSVCKYPKSEEGIHSTMKREYFKRYFGTERREAFKEAAALAKQYKVEFIKTGWWK